MRKLRELKGYIEFKIKGRLRMSRLTEQEYTNLREMVFEASRILEKVELSLCTKKVAPNFRKCLVMLQNNITAVQEIFSNEILGDLK